MIVPHAGGTIETTPCLGCGIETAWAVFSHHGMPELCAFQLTPVGNNYYFMRHGAADCERARYVKRAFA